MMLPPGMPMILLAIGLLALRGSRWERVRRVATVLAPLLSLAHLAILVPEDAFCRVRWLDLELTIVRADRLAMIWGWLFHVAAILAAIYSLYDRSSLDAAFGLIYAGSAIAAVFAGDLLTLFLFWELTALASAYLVWAGQQRGSPDAGTRYLIVQVGSGVLLLAGTLGLAYGGSEVGITFGGPSEIGVFRDQLNQWPVQLIFGAFCVKAAFPIVHTWLPDAYPKSSPVGAVFLSAFTTKMAIYMLVRGFAGWPPLIAVGCAMAIAPLVYAVVEDDLRRCLAYCLVNQLGFMVVAIGVGTPLAINGVAGHAISHVLYKGLLFMVAGAILHRTGTARLSKLGGLATQMPFTFAAYLFAVAAISMPMFSGFVTKSLSVAAVGEAHLQSAWLCLLAATTGVFWICGPRIAYFAFLRPAPPASCPAESFASSPCDRPLPTSQQTPLCMKVAMGSAAIAGLILGLSPAWIYGLLPYSVDYAPYTVPHVLFQLQLMVAAAAGFVVLRALHATPAAGSLRDIDSFYLGPLATAVSSLVRITASIRDVVVSGTFGKAVKLSVFLNHWIGRRR